MSNITIIVGYVYGADMFCTRCVIDAMERHEGAAKEILAEITTEEYLDAKAQELRVDRYNERTYDSQDFPKVVFASQVYMDYCGLCDECLLCGTHALMHDEHC